MTSLSTFRNPILKMAANRLRLTSYKFLHKYNVCSAYRVQKSLYCTAKCRDEEITNERKSGFAEFDKKQQEILKEPKTPPERPAESFVSLLRNSNFIAMGDPVGKVVVGQIFNVTGKDLYIDFGWKFPAVCTAPERNKNLYVVGAKVIILIKDLELATKFLGSEEEITLCEADCVLLGLKRPPSIQLRGQREEMI